MARNVRRVSWLKAARKDFKDFPIEAQVEVARALTVVAEGRHPDIAKPFKGAGSGVFELALRHRGDACRVVYAVQIDEEIRGDPRLPEEIEVGDQDTQSGGGSDP
jgi:phage-related protein